MSEDSPVSCSCGSSFCTTNGEEVCVDNEKKFKEIHILGLCGLIYAFTLIFGSSIEGFAGTWLVNALYAVPLAICGFPVLRTAFKAMLQGDIFNEFSLMSIATIAAVVINEVPEAVAVMLFYRVGEYVQEKATAKSVRSIKSLLASKPTIAHVFVQNELQTKKVEEVEVGSFVQVWAGEKIPLDGIVITGTSEIDQSPLTGEFVPIVAEPGKKLFGGSINKTGVLALQVTSPYADTQMARILEMVQTATENKSPTERFISKFAKYYTPFVVACALLVAVLPPLVAGLSWEVWIYRALVLLVISCPCALLISIPLGYFGGIGAASHSGILVKGGAVFDDLTNIDTVVFDKTGTLTHGSFTVADIVVHGTASKEEILLAALVAEQASNHPIARSIRAHASAQGIVSKLLAEEVSVQELAGMGMSATVGQDRFLAGNANLLKEFGIEASTQEQDKEFLAATLVHVAKNNEFIGTVVINDSIKEDAKKAIAEIKELGLKTYMLSGDKELAASWVASELGLNGYWAELLPEGKVQAMKALTDASRTMFVGDGLNDAPTLAHARVGVAMGQMGAEAAIEAASVVIANDSPSNVPKLLRLSRKVRSIVWQNIFLALGVKTSFMVLGIVGLSGLWEAVFADVGVALLAVLNATRASRS